MRIGVLLSAALACGFAGTASAQSTYGQARALALYNELVDDGGCESALPEARTFWPSVEFDTQLPLADQQNFLAAVVQCAWSLGDSGAAMAAANRAHELGADWAEPVRLSLGLGFDNDALAVQAFFDLAQESPKRLNDLQDYNVWGALRAAEQMQGGEAVALRMHDLLAAADYEPPDHTPDDFFRLDHARLLLAAGRVDDARARLRGVVDPQAVMLLRVNRAYEALRGDPEFERRLDIAASADLALERAARLRSEHPRVLSLVTHRTRLLRDVGRSADALAELEPVLAAAQAPDASDRFDDLNTELNWLLQAKANLLYDLGRTQEARDVYGQAIGTQGTGPANIIINFAGQLNGEGRGGDAREVMRLIGRITDYGDMWGTAERVCAAAQLHDASTIASGMVNLRAGEEDNPAALMHAVLCTDDVEAAKALMIRRLANPRQREMALLALQPYRYLETRRMPQEWIELQRLAAVRDDPAVRAAVEAVGRIEPTPLFAN